MKKNLLHLLPLACVLLLAGCEREPKQNWFHNADLVFLVEDGSGNNLLDADYADNILHDGVSVVYKGKTYRLQGVTRAAEGYVAPQFDGLRLWKNWNSQIPTRMAFGQLGIVSDSSLGEREYRSEKLTVNWGGEENLTSEIEFDLYATVKDGEATINQAIRVVGGVGAGASSGNSLIVTIVK